MTDWPSTLPDAPLVGLSDKDDDAVLRTPMDTGPGTRRNRFGAITRSVRAPIILTGAERTIFDSFFRTTLNHGADEFDWTDPATGATATFAFKAPVDWSCIRPDEDPDKRLWQGTMELEIQP